MLQAPREVPSNAVDFDITPSASSSSTSNYCLKTWPPRLGRVHFVLVMYTMDTERLSSRRLLLSVGTWSGDVEAGRDFFVLARKSS